MTYSLDELTALSLARQFPAPMSSIAAAVSTIGPMQSQTARSPFLGLAARFPGLSRADLTVAYEAGEVVRGSTIRGTVHTTTPAGFTALGVATAIGQRRLFERSLGLVRSSLDDLWRDTEAFAATWRSVDELVDHLRKWLAAHEGAEASSRVVDTFGRYLSFGHGGLVRRPVKGDWSSQGTPEYRAVADVGTPSMTDVIALHLAVHGPATRKDLAWWSGCGLRVIDAALDKLGLIGVPGPAGHSYVDVAAPPPGITLDDVRLLPEFDALMCAYDPAGRGRFADTDHLRVLWNQKNGLVLPPLLVDGRITGYWRTSGSARRRSMEVTWFAGTRKPRRCEIDAASASVAAALDIEITSVTLSREVVA